MRSTLQLDIVEMRVRNQREKQNHHHDCLFRLLTCLADARCSIARSVTVSMSSHENKQAKCLPDALRRHNTTNANATGKYIRPFFFFIVPRRFRTAASEAMLHWKTCCTHKHTFHRTNIKITTYDMHGMAGERRKDKKNQRHLVPMHSTRSQRELTRTHFVNTRL